MTRSNTATQRDVFEIVKSGVFDEVSSEMGDVASRLFDCDHKARVRKIILVRENGSHVGETSYCAHCGAVKAPRESAPAATTTDEVGENGEWVVPHGFKAFEAELIDLITTTIQARSRGQ